jgi:hypothetical protein
MSSQHTESDKELDKFEKNNPSVEFFILMSSEGVPFKYNSIQEYRIFNLSF